MPRVECAENVLGSQQEEAEHGVLRQTEAACRGMWEEAGQAVRQACGHVAGRWVPPCSRQQEQQQQVSPSLTVAVWVKGGAQ